MKKVAHQTSRVLWQMGQALLPEHFYAQEQSLREELNLRARLLRAPFWGVGSLAWDGFQLLRGIVSVQELTLVLPSGTLVDVPGNTAPAFVNLKAAGRRAEVYVHLQGGFDTVSLGARGEPAEEGIERIVQKIELSTSPFSETSAQSFKLAEFESGPDGAWALLDGYVPPHVQVGASPFFESHLRRVEGVARALRQALVDEIHERYLAAEGNATGRMALRGLFALQGLLADLRAGVLPHPYELFSALRSLHVDLCLHRDVSPSEAERAYDHEDLAGCLSALVERLEDQAQPGRAAVPYVEFVRRDGLLVCELGREARRAKDVFLLVQKPQTSAKADLGRAKLAAASRLHTVYERSLRGIPLRRLEEPPFQHGLASTVEFYAASPGEEWDHAVREGSVALFDDPQLRSLRFFLYWRSE
ncbi:MAG TPA: type VI secretion system baseplate subunit TssK [Polyangiaceae bacterium]|nr:type VI secretion system baseplate subunit TssK [Polyangiaceae bacterium]